MLRYMEFKKCHVGTPCNCKLQLHLSDAEYGQYHYMEQGIVGSQDVDSMQVGRKNV